MSWVWPHIQTHVALRNVGGLGEHMTCHLFWFFASFFRSCRLEWPSLLLTLEWLTVMMFFKQLPSVNMWFVILSDWASMFLASFKHVCSWDVIESNSWLTVVLGKKSFCLQTYTELISVLSLQDSLARLSRIIWPIKENSYSVYR